MDGLKVNVKDEDKDFTDELEERGRKIKGSNEVNLRK